LFAISASLRPFRFSAGRPLLYDIIVSGERATGKRSSLRMIFSENRFPLFGIMRQNRIDSAKNMAAHVTREPRQVRR
jgi:hypothetical protein